MRCSSNRISTVAPLDQQALTDWIEAQLDQEAAALEVKRERTGIAHPHDPGRR
jgi:hypothetical protein